MRNLLNTLSDLKSSEDIYDYSIKIYSMFILEDDGEKIKKYLHNIENIDFIDYNTWTWIEPLISLKSRLNNENSDIKKKCNSKIKEVLSIGNKIQIQVKNNVFQRVLRGEELYDDLIIQAQKEKNIELEKEATIKSIMQLVTIIEMGGSKVFSIESAEKKLNKLKEAAQKILSNQ